MKLAVTGAHGFLGSHVVDAARLDGADVVAVVSPWGRTDRLAAHAHDPAVRLLRADVTDPASLNGVFDGVDAVVHAAARVADHGPWRAFHRVNVQGTANVARAAVRSGVARVVLVSSVAVWRYRGISGDDPRTRPRDQHVLPYGRSKALAEDVVRAAAPEPVVVRPALWPYGTRDPNLARVATALRRGVLPLVDGGRARLQTVDAALLATALVVCARDPVAIGRSYLVADPGAPTWRELFGEIAELLGASPPRLALPGGPLEAVAPAFESAWASLRLRGEPPLTRYRAGLMRSDVVLDASAAYGELGVRPTRTRRAALEAALRDLDGTGAPPLGTAGASPR
ncbi:MAG: NAD-dependent epimerase/dehydratase family protein [Trueperaceae bacterium]|nr:NAD-dependent epimerase/dehydratase family protein [Trueperaceae bacterium]